MILTTTDKEKLNQTKKPKTNTANHLRHPHSPTQHKKSPNWRAQRSDTITRPQPKRDKNSLSRFGIQQNVQIVTVLITGLYCKRSCLSSK